MPCRRISGLLLAAALLAGCGDDGGTTTTAAGDSPRPCDTRPDSDDVYEGFPVDEVPVLEGEVTDSWNGRDNGEYGCSLAIARDDDAATAVPEAVALLVEVGFRVVVDNVDDASSPYARLEADEYRIGVSGYDTYDGPGSTVSYDLRGPYLEEAYEDEDADDGDAELPTGFPEDEVPLVEGRVVAAVTGETGSSYTVEVRTERTASASGEAAMALLDDAGFAVVTPLEVEVGSGSAELATGSWRVWLLVSEDKEEQQVTVTYDVGPAG